jgi:hypothetical protein
MIVVDHWGADTSNPPRSWKRNADGPADRDKTGVIMVTTDYMYSMAKYGAAKDRNRSVRIPRQSVAARLADKAPCLQRPRLQSSVSSEHRG